MSTAKTDLISSFRDGSLPSGEDFRELIETMATEDELAQLRARVAAMAAPELLTFGPSGQKWTLAPQDGQLRLFRTTRPPGDQPGDVALSGLVSMGGRIGAAQGADLYAEAAPVMAAMALPALPTKHGWQTLLAPPGRAVAFEIVLYAPAGAGAGQTNLLKRLVGIAPPEDTVIHATATATADGLQTSLSEARSPGRAGILRRFAWVLAGLVLLLTALLAYTGGDVTAIPAQLEAALAALGRVPSEGISALTPGAIGLALAALVALREVVVAATRWRASALLRWRSGSFNPFKPHPRSLQVKAAGAVPASPTTLIRYALTRLWD
ncbi:hypothetical protein [Vannielia litorea]|uniref:hypothetical protein n=1 Tax=Vannielia litorea TaxID=1217970 RepID=UPI001BD0E207|nr:hypothetical protein [Vannielia litorea]MBS8226340.1 hypothetical protein [Vannielia litorea]